MVSLLFSTAAQAQKLDVTPVAEKKVAQCSGGSTPFQRSRRQQAAATPTALAVEIAGKAIAVFKLGEDPMKIRWSAAIAMLVSMAAGAAAVEGLHAQAKPPVYFIGEIEVTNPEGYAKEYLPKAREIIEEHGGQLVAAGGAAGSGNSIVGIDGEPPKRVVIYRYPSIDEVHAWRNDPAYEAVRQVGEKYAKYRTFAVVGVPQ